MGIAEQMGNTLRRTSVSTNIKERLDFSCALFSYDGGLVANAPHLPIHLGSMQEAVRWQIHYLKDDWKEGDVIVSNNPHAGGSHLPDITVMTPFYADITDDLEEEFKFSQIWKESRFTEDHYKYISSSIDQVENKRSGSDSYQKRNRVPVFYVAARGHHADIGGIAPGSMPPFSKWLVEEGACITSFTLVKNSEFQEEGITHLLNKPETIKQHRAYVLNNRATRNLSDNISDLKAQVAANHRGISLLRDLTKEYGLKEVLRYMIFIQKNAEESIRQYLVELSLRERLNEIDTLRATDYMDDGTRLCLSITIDRTSRHAIFDFTGTDTECLNNLNSPPSITSSAIMYSLRCLLQAAVAGKDDLPLNEGFLKAVKIIIPPFSILNPSVEAAVVGGNVLTSQRITDIVLYAFKAAANSQGCMNNFTFGSDTLGGYYETIAGGGGAGPTWHGESAVHSHMTNTRITDPEILEKRYPIQLEEFSIRKNSGGKGKYRGGDGIVRRIRFLAPMTASILSERRAFAPNGLFGGGEAVRGKNIWTQSKTNRQISLGGKNTIFVEINDMLTIFTPGGGGCYPTDA